MNDELTRAIKNNPEIRTAFENVKHLIMAKGWPENEVDESVNSIMHLDQDISIMLILAFGLGFLASFLMIPFFLITAIVSLNNYVTMVMIAFFSLMNGFIAHDITKKLTYSTRFKIITGALVPVIPSAMLFAILGFYEKLKIPISSFVSLNLSRNLASNVYNFEPFHSLVFGFVLYVFYNVFIAFDAMKKKRAVDLAFYIIGPLLFFITWIIMEFLVRGFGGSLA